LILDVETFRFFFGDELLPLPKHLFSLEFPLLASQFPLANCGLPLKFT